MKSRHKVHDNIEDKDPQGREGNVCCGIREGDGRRTVEAVAGLLAQNRSANHLKGHLSEGIKTDGQNSGENDTISPSNQKMCL
jgi:hypothetical protein